MEVIDRIRQQITQQPVIIFMKGTPARPMCRDSHEAARLLDACHVDYHYVDVQADPEIRAYLPKYSDSSKFPQLFLQGELIGGATILRELYEQDELQEMLVRSRAAQALAN